MQKAQSLFNKFLESKKVFWVVLISIFVIARMAAWLYPYDSDHWIFYYVGKAIANGKLLYVDAWDHKPPLIFEFNALLHMLFGGNLGLHRVFLTLLAIFDIFLFYKLAKTFAKVRNLGKESADKITRIALLLYVFWRNLSQFTSSGNNTENIGLIFLLLMYLAFFKFYSLVRSRFSSVKSASSSVKSASSSVIPAKAGIQKKNDIDSRRSLSTEEIPASAGMTREGGNDKKKVGNDNLVWLFLSGACLSVLFYLKPNMSLLSIPILVEIFLLSYKSIKKFVVNYLVFGAAFLIQTAFWIFYFNSQNALKDFWAASFAFSSAYAKSTWSGNVSPQKVFIFMLLPLIIPLAIFAYRFLKDIKKIKNDDTYRFLFFMFVSSVAFGLALGSFYPYYFLILLPSFTLVIVYSLFRHPERSVAKPKDLLVKEKRDSSTRYSVESVGMTVGILILLTGMFISFGISTKQLLNSFSGPVKAELNEYQQISDYIRTNSNPNDKIVAYTYGAVLYRMAERDSGSRFISASILLLDERDQYGFHLSDTFISDLEKSKPKYWIISKDENSLYYQNKKIILYMLNNFGIEKEFDNYLVLRHK